MSRRVAALLFAWALAQAPSSAYASLSDGDANQHGHDAMAIPLVSYTTDQGIGAGVVGGILFYDPGYRPYRHALALGTYVSRSGVQRHYLRYDGPNLLGPVRVEARLEYDRELLSPFFGPGNLSAPEFSGNIEDPRYNYIRTSPVGWLRLRTRPFGQGTPLEVYAGYFYRHTWIRSYPGSLLQADRPLGFEGGAVGQLMGGALWDTRDDETDPSRGAVDEVSVRLASRAWGSHYGFAGVTLADQRYVRLGRRWLFAERVLLDATAGQVPFFEWPDIGGLLYTEGLGGVTTVRGLPRDRFAGNVKALANLELRASVGEAAVFGVPVRFGVVGFLDAGRVWHPGLWSGPWQLWHPGAGLGLRATHRAAVVRLDWATSPETRRQALYLAFGQIF